MIHKYIVPVLLFLCLSVSISYPKDDQSYLLSFIPSICCVTNECCWSISEQEVTGLPNGDYIINATGQRMSSRGSPYSNEKVGKLHMSPDQKFYRCACDDKGTYWEKHEKAHSRCLFIPNRGF